MEQQVNVESLSKYKKVIYKRITWYDVLIIIFGFIMSLILAIFFYGLPVYYFVPSTFSVLIFCIILVLPANEVFKVYNVLINYFTFLFSRKIYSKKSKKFLEPYKKMTIDGLVKFKNNSYMKIIKLQGFNIDILLEDEKEQVVYSLRNVFRESNLDFSISKIEIKNGIKNKVNQLQSYQDKSKNKAIIEALEISAKGLVAQKELDETKTKNYFLYVYGDKNEIELEFQKIINYLKLAKLNPQVCLNDKLKQAVFPFWKFELDEDKEYDLKNLSEGKTHFKHKYFKRDGKYWKVYSITRVPKMSYLGWMAPLANVENTIFITHFKEYDKATAIKRIDKALSVLEIGEISVKKASQTLQMEDYYDSMKDLNKWVNSGGEQLYSSNSFIIIKANTLNEMWRTAHNIESKLKNLNFGYIDSNSLQKEAWFASVPKPSNNLNNITSNEIGTLSAAQTFPFLGNNLNDPKGLYLGYTGQGENIYLDFGTVLSKRTNRNIAILGSSGSGKSTTAKKIIKDRLLMGDKVICLDAERELKKLTSHFHGTWISLGADGKEGEFSINPLQFMSEVEDNRPRIGQHIETLEHFFNLLFPDIDHLQMMVLKSAVEELYKNFGIDEKRSKKNISNKDFPIMSDLYELIKDKAKTSKAKPLIKDVLDVLEVYLTVFKKGSSSAENKMWGKSNQGNIFNAQLITFDVRSLLLAGNNRTANAQLFMLLVFVYSMLIQNKSLTKQTGWIFIDEAHLYINESMPYALRFISQMVKRARKYNAGLITATQNLGDFLKGNPDIVKQASGIINNSQYTIVLGLKTGDISALNTHYESIGGLSSEEVEFLKRADRGKGILTLSDSNRMIFTVDLMKEELELWE